MLKVKLPVGCKPTVIKPNFRTTKLSNHLGSFRSHFSPITVAPRLNQKYLTRSLTTTTRVQSIGKPPIVQNTTRPTLQSSITKVPSWNTSLMCKETERESITRKYFATTPGQTSWTSPTAVAIKIKDFFVNMWRGIVQLYRNTLKANEIRRREKY